MSLAKQQSSAFVFPNGKWELERAHIQPHMFEPESKEESDAKEESADTSLETSPNCI